ncbi:MAG: aromatic ring-hydroxylating dioxygenase subunit alpha [Burkholderiales bacterium]|nr:aromatic ring-hydroxylating dioxygenase subunit alpha [Burkholderiales bacterium]
MDSPVSGSPSKAPLSYSGYHRPLTGAPDRYLCQVGRGTPGGEYLRRYWHPVAFVDELKDVPVRVRALGEDLVVFKDGQGQIGCLHLHCAHRRTSLEYGVISERGLRCCYHGWVFDVDGQVLEIPGDPNAAKIAERVSQGAYPVHTLGGLVFIYMGPPEKRPPFPRYERFDLPGVKLVPGGPRLPFPCNWIQIKENAMDPAHTAVLHAIPAVKGVDHFAKEFAAFPEFAFMRTPAGMMYLAARKVGDRVWVRSTDYVAPNVHSISSIFEGGRQVKGANTPFRTIWTTPVDDDYSINFTISHVEEGDDTPMEKRRYLELFGQTDERPYVERQRIPGDWDAMVSQGPIEIHELENLDIHDQGVVMFRRMLRQEIERVARGDEPTPLPDPIPTFCNDRIVPAATVEGGGDDRASLKRFAHKVGEDYIVEPPLAQWKPGNPAKPV